MNLVAGGKDFAAGEVNLEAAHPGLRAAWGPNLGGEVGERGDVVTGHRRRVGQLRAGQLHTIPRVAAKANGGVFELDNRFSRLKRFWGLGLLDHGWNVLKCSSLFLGVCVRLS